MNITFDQLSAEFVLEALSFSVDGEGRWILENGDIARCFYCQDPMCLHNLAGIINLEGIVLCCKKHECLHNIEK